MLANSKCSLASIISVPSFVLPGTLWGLLSLYLQYFTTVHLHTICLPH